MHFARVVEQTSEMRADRGREMFYIFNSGHIMCMCLVSELYLVRQIPFFNFFAFT